MNLLVLGRSGVLASPQVWRRADRSASSGDRRDPTATGDGIDGPIVGCRTCARHGSETAPVGGSILRNGRLREAEAEEVQQLVVVQFTFPRI